MSAIAHHLVRRGFEEFQERARLTSDKGGEKIHIPSWASLSIPLTVLLFTLSLFAIQYTYGEVVATLAAVEAPSTTAIIRTAPQESDEPDAPLLSFDEKSSNAQAADQEILLIKQRPLTSRFCAIKRHLRARGGRGARFRGLHIYLLNSLLFNVVFGIFSSMSFFRRHLISLCLLEIATYTLLTRFSLLWTHLVISEPSTKSWLQRMPERSVVRKALAPTATAVAVSKISSMLFVAVAIFTGAIPSPYHPLAAPHSGAGVVSIPSALITLMLALFITIGIQIPTEIAITRVRASLLAEEETPIISFDRSFNGQVVPMSAGGSGILGLWTAWAGCDMATRFRVLGVYAKTFAMQITMVIVGMLAVFAQIRIALGPEYQEKIHALVLQNMDRP